MEQVQGVKGGELSCFQGAIRFFIEVGSWAMHYAAPYSPHGGVMYQHLRIQVALFIIRSVQPHSPSRLVW